MSIHGSLPSREGNFMLRISTVNKLIIPIAAIKVLL